MTTINAKDRRIVKLWNIRGMRDPIKIAKKLGYQDLDAGAQRVNECIGRNKLQTQISQ
jgi:hypothetical protein